MAILCFARADGSALASEGMAAVSKAVPALNSATRAADGHGFVDPREGPVEDEERAGPGIVGAVLIVGGQANGCKVVRNPDVLAAFDSVFSAEVGAGLLLATLGVTSPSSSMS